MNSKKTTKSKNSVHTSPKNSILKDSTREPTPPEVEGLSFSILLEGIPHLVIVMGRDGAARYVNRRWLEYTGLDLEHSLGSGWLKAIHLYDRQQTALLHNWDTTAPQRVEVECRLANNTGVFHWFLLRVEPVLEDKIGDTASKPRQLTGWICTATNVDEQKRTRDTFEFLYQTTPNGILLQDATAKIIDANPAAQRILGLSLEQLQSRTSPDPRWQAILPDGTLLPNDQRPSILALHTGKTSSGTVVGFYNPILEQRRWVGIDAVPQFQLGEDQPYQVYTQLEDITERRRIRLELEQAVSKLEQVALEREQAASKLEQVVLELEQVALERERLLEQISLERLRLDAVLIQMPPGVIIVDANNRRVSLVNNQIERIFSVPLTLGMTLEHTFVPTFHPNGKRLKRSEFPLHRALEGHAVSSEEIEIQRPDGSRAIVLASAGPIHDRLGKIIAAVFTCEDLTERRHAEAEVQRLTRSIQSARLALTLHGGRPVTPERFVELLGELYTKLGLPQLEGGLVALLLMRAEPMSLGEAAKLLGVSKVAISKVSNAMLERGDMLISKAFSSREHLLALTNHSYIRDLTMRQVASWSISILCDAMLETNHLEPAVTEQVRTHLETHTRVAVALEQVLLPLEQGQANSLAEHLLKNWDAVQPKELPKDSIKDLPEDAKDLPKNLE